MDSIIELITQEITSLDDFLYASNKVKEYIEENKVRIINSTSSNYSSYIIPIVRMGENEIKVRPLNNKLFIWDNKVLLEKYDELCALFKTINQTGRVTEDIKLEYKGFLSTNCINKVLYTLQRGVGCGLDIFTSSNRARKNVGLRFEDLIEQVFFSLNVTNIRERRLNVEVEVEGEIITYRSGADFVISNMDAEEIIRTSIKTTSKDRMSPIFLSKYYAEKTSAEAMNFIAVFLNDVQRKGSDGISNTFVSNRFIIDWTLLTPLDGVYYIDPPEHINRQPWKTRISTFDKLIIEDLWAFGLSVNPILI